MALNFLNNGIFAGEVTISTIPAVGSDTDKFLMSNSGVISFATGAEVLAFIGGAPAGGGAYLELAGNSVADPMTGNIIMSNGNRLMWTADDPSGALSIHSNASNSFIQHTGTGYFQISNDCTGGIQTEMLLTNFARNQPIRFQADNGNPEGTTSCEIRDYFFLDGASATYASGASTAVYTVFPDLSYIAIGTGKDLQIYHDGSNSYINETGTGGLVVKTGDFYLRNPSNAEMITASSAAAVKLYYNNSLKFETTNTGVTVTGDITVTGGDITSNGLQIISNSTTASTLLIGDVTLGDTIQEMRLQVYGADLINLQDDEISLKSSTVKITGSLSTTAPATYLGLLSSTGILTKRTPAQVLSDIGGAPATGGSYLPLAGGTMTGNIVMGDNDITGIDQLIFSGGTYLTNLSSNYIELRYASTGAGGIYVVDGDGTTQGYLYADGGGTSSFGLLDGTGSWAVRCLENEYVELRYDNVTKFATTSTGVTVTGAATATTFLGDLNGTINTVTTATTQVNAIDNDTVATTAYVNNKIALIPAGLVFQGTWNASTNTPTLTSGSGTTGNFYIVSVAGSTNLDGITDWKVGDWAVFIEQGASDQWEKIDNSSVLDGLGTGQTLPLWAGSGTSNTLTDSIITQTGSSPSQQIRITSENDAQLRLEAPSSWAGIHWVDGSGSDYIWYNGVNSTFAIGGGGSNISGKKLHIDGSTSIGSNYDAASPPTNGLVIEGQVGIGTTSIVGSWLSGFDPSTGNSTFQLTSEGWVVTPYLTGLAGYYPGQGARPIVWADDSGTNLQCWDNSATDGISLRSSNGTTRLFVKEDGNVGIGTTSPSSLLHLKKDSGDPMLNIQAVASGDPGITFTSINNRTGNIFYSDGTTNAKLSYDHADTSFKLYAHNTTVADFVLNETTSYFPTQNVGIGTTSPGAKLHLSTSDQKVFEINSTDGDGPYTVYTTSGTVKGYVGSAAALANEGTANFAVRAQGDLVFATGGSTQRMRIDSSGNVTLAITNATSNTVIGKDATGMYMETAGSTDALSDMRFQARASGAGSYSAIRIKPSNQSLDFQTSNTVRMLINNVGNVGIGTTLPLSLSANTSSLSINSTRTDLTGGIFLKANDTSKVGLYWATDGLITEITSGNALWYLGNSERMRISSAGAIKFNAYDSTNQTGTPTYLLGTDASGNLVKTNTVPGSGAGPYLPLSAGSSYPLTGDLYLKTATNEGNLFFGTASASYKIFGGGTYGYMGYDTGGYHRFNVLGSEVVRIASGIMQFKDNALISSNTADGTDNAQIIISGGGASGDTRGATVHLAGNENGNQGLLQLRAGDGATSQIRSYTSGSERMRIDSNGNVGIGTTSPDQALDVEHGNIRIKSDNDGNNGIFMLYDSAGTQAGQIYPSAGDLRLYSPNDIIMLQSGNVGIGTTSPTGLTSGVSSLSLGGSNSTTSGGLFYQVNGTYKAYSFVGSNVWYHRGEASVSQAFLAGGVERMRITSAGNVGIGTTTPDARLEVENNVNGSFYSVFVKNPSGGSSAFVSKKWLNDDAGFGEIWRNSSTRSSGGQAASSFNIYNSADMNFWSGGTHTMALVQDSVGIGTISPAAKLDISNVTGGTYALEISTPERNRALFFYNSASTTDAGYLGIKRGSVDALNHRFATTGNSAVCIEEGNFGIGTDSPDAKLDVESTVDYQIMAKYNATNYASYGYYGLDVIGGGNPYIFKLQGTERMRITSGGAVRIGTTTYPDSEKLTVAGGITVSSGTYNFLSLSLGTNESIIESKGTYQGMEIGTTGASGSVFIKTANTTKMTILPGGNVGIGTTNPSYQLSIENHATTTSTAIMELDGKRTDGNDGAVGELIFSNNGDTFATVAGFRDGADNSGSIVFQTQDSGTFGTRMTISSDGNVGIGTDQGVSKLNVLDSISLVAGSEVTGIINSGTEFIDFRAGDGVTISATRVLRLTDVNAIVTGTCTATNFILSSDETLKDNIKEIESKHIDVNWKNFELKSEPGVKRSGVIAQELEKKHPEFVRTNDEGLKSVAYIDLLISKIAELEARLEKAGI